MPGPRQFRDTSFHHGRLQLSIQGSHGLPVISTTIVCGFRAATAEMKFILPARQRQPGIASLAQY